MGDEIRIAADRRGEVRVRRAAQAGVTEVAIGVVGLLERAEHKRCIRLAAVASAFCLAADEPARGSRQLAGLLGGDGVGQRGRRKIEGRQLLDQPADPLGVRLLVDAVEGGDATALEQLGDLLVGEDHQLLDQAVGLGLLDRVRADDLSVLEAELGLGALNVERRAGPASREGRSRLPCERQRLGDPAGRPRPTAEDLVELVVVEPRVRADQAAVEARRERLAGLRDLNLGGDGEPVLVGDEAADVGGEDLRQHRRHPSRDIGGVSPPVGLLLDGAARANVRRDVGDVDPEAIAALGPGGGHSVVEVVGARGVDREGREIPDVPAIEAELPRRGGRVGRLPLDPLSEPDPHVAVREHRVDHVGGQAWISELSDHPRPPTALADLHQGHAPRSGGAAPAADLDAAPSLEEQLADEEPAALGDEDDAPLARGTCRPRRQGC